MIPTFAMVELEADDALAAAVDVRGFKAHRAPDIADEVAGLLANGSVVGWFQEAMEFGPRALGNRSLLADPRRADMRETLNRKVKHREAFRPFAPSVLEERVSDYFELAELMLRFPDRRGSGHG